MAGPKNPAPSDTPPPNHPPPTNPGAVVVTSYGTVTWVALPQLLLPVMLPTPEAEPVSLDVRLVLVSVVRLPHAWFDPPTRSRS